MKNSSNFIKHHWAIVWITAAWFLFSSPYFFKGLVPFPSKYLVTFFPPWNAFNGMPVKNNAMPDVITQIYPWKKLVIESFKLRQIPAWNPYQFSGTPLLAGAQSAVFSPVNALFLIFPFIDAWSVIILLQPIAAGLGMYFYLRCIAVSKAGSTVASISFMFCGFITVWMAYGTLGYAMVYLPIILYGIERYRRTRESTAVILIIASVTLSVFSGHLQTSIYVIATACLYSLFQFIVTKNPMLFIRYIVYISLGLILASPQLIPTLRFYQQAIRSELFQKGEVIPWSYLPTIIAPDFFGNPVTRNDWYGHYAEWASFVGVIPFVLAASFLWSKKRHPIQYFYIMLSISAILLAYDSPLIDTIVGLRLPVISTSAFSRIIVLLSFAVAILSGFGFDTLVTDWDNRKNLKRFLLVGTCMTLFIGGIWILLFFGNLLWVNDVTDEKLTVAMRNFMMPTILLLSSVFLIGIGYRLRSIGRYTIIGILLLLTTFDLVRFASKWMPFDPREYIYPKIALLEYLEIHATRSRVWGNFGNEAQSPFHLQGLEGYDPLYIRRYGEFIAAAADGDIHSPSRSTVLLDKQGKYTKKLIDLLGVRYFLYAKGDERNVWSFPYWNYPESFGAPVYGDDHYEIYENSHVLPRAFLVHEYTVGKNDAEVLKEIFERLDIARRIVLEEEPEKIDRAVDDGNNTNERVNMVTFTPNQIIMNVISKGRGLLFLSDAYYPGWSAYVNGKPTKIFRANYAFRAVVVPDGVSVVKFSYDHWFL